MGRYRTYGEYKDSGVEWVGNIPIEWQVKPLFAVASTESVKNFDGAENNVLSLSYGNIVQRDVEDNFGLLPESFNTYQLVSPGDLILRLTDLQNDKRSLRVGQAKEKGIITSAYLKLTAKKQKLNERFFYRLLHSYDTTKVFYGMGGGLRQSMKFEEMKRLQILTPSIAEQEKIANFLDHETAKIDTLIAKQQQLIALLKEKRQAVISHAVTKGLNPNAPMRDSGVEWLGEVPAHWELAPLKYLCKFCGGGTPSKDNLSYWSGGNVPWVSPKDMKTFWINETQDKLTEKAVIESSTSFIEPGALLMVVRSGILQRTIPIAINTVQVTLNQDMKAFNFNGRMNTEYAANYILGNVHSLLLEWSKEGATVESIEHEYLANSLFPVPPIDEQEAINQKIERRMTAFKNLESNALHGIQLLQERRTAIISAAVTGKIDVRDWSPSVTAALPVLNYAVVA